MIFVDGFGFGSHGDSEIITNEKAKLPPFKGEFFVGLHFFRKAFFTSKSNLKIPNPSQGFPILQVWLSWTCRGFRKHPPRVGFFVNHQDQDARLKDSTNLPFGQL